MSTDQPLPPTSPSDPGAAAAVRPGELVDRFLARLVDGVILGVSYAILAALLGTVFLGGFDPSGFSVFLYWLLLSVLTSAGYLAYFALLESRRGATIGKQVLKLQVVGPDGRSLPTLEQAVRRNVWVATGLVGVVPIVGSFLGGLLGLVAAVLIAVGINADTTGRQAWHDRFAGGTRVLKLG